VIRQARADEAETLAAIQRDASLAALAHIFPPERYPYPIAEIRQRWSDALADPVMTVLVAEQDTAIGGVAACRAEWLDGLYVRPALWGHGVGRELHDEVLDRLRAGGSARCHLWVL
jgi:GNAT superfamily N-acetyltransferase